MTTPSPDYTPTSGDVKAHYSHSRFMNGGTSHLEGRAEFDRWLAAHDRAVKAQGWDEGNHAGCDRSENHPNPYRRAES